MYIRHNFLSLYFRIDVSVSCRFLDSGNLDTKNDVYSFGIVLLELITGQTAVNKNGNLLNWVKSMDESIKLEDIVDSKLQGYKYNPDSVRKVIDIALSCTAPTYEERPTMSEVLLKLRNCVELKSAQSETSQASNQATFEISSEMFPADVSTFYNPKAR
jgi:serine/threonine protein kinase